MADFVIKPGAGVSNKLILKTQDNTDVLTTSASSATLADGIALGTPASGVMTNMTGTPSAINLANGTFPTGHIVKFEKVVTQPTASQGGSTTYADLTGSSITYTPATGATSVVYSCQFYYGGDNAGSEDMALWHIMYDGTAEYGTQGFTYLGVGSGAYAIGQKTHQYIRNAWSGSKTIKIRQRSYSASTYGWFHRQTYGSTDVANESAPNTTSNYMKVYTTIYSVM